MASFFMCKINHVNSIDIKHAFDIINMKGGGYPMARNSGIVEVSQKFEVKLQTVLNWCEKGLPHEESYKGINKVKRFDLEEVEKWIKEQRGN